MNLPFLRIEADEGYRFILIVALFFLNSVILESNEVIATSGFISNIGVQHVVWVWTVDMTIVMLTAALYSIVVDQTDRIRLTIWMFAGFGCGYFLLYKLFQLQHLTWLTYPLLTIINDQQWSLFGLLIWALATDAFNTAQAKRLFPLFAMAAMLGSVAGNASVAALPLILHTPGYVLLLVNAFLMVLLAAAIWTAHASQAFSTTIRPTHHGSHQGARREENLRDIFTEGMGFIRDIPSFRYLAFAMIPLGLGLNALEFHFLSTIVSTDTATVQTVYGAFKVAMSVSILAIQALFVTKLVNEVGLRRIFMLMPMAQLIALLSVFALPLYGIFLGNYLARVTLVAVDEPARQMLFGLAPDERRGRVSAFMNGYLYPLGAIIGCLLIGTLMYLTQLNYLHLYQSQLIYLGTALIAVLVALWMVIQIHKSYDLSLLNWRLERRKRRSKIPSFEF